MGMPGIRLPSPREPAERKRIAAEMRAVGTKMPFFRQKDIRRAKKTGDEYIFRIGYMLWHDR
ncbi:MAG: hypothetical protein A4E70_01502 [Syntrophus sp. PtaU1.Bin005]|nr:MAG: hypothetical protein A4E70_01502 [Syntrophus sp. PtaU1.Bin005]